MKKRVYLFITASLITLSIAPAINLSEELKSDKPLLNTLREWKSVSYNMDFILAPIGRVLYAAGVSISPEKVILGKDGWMFLGDSFEKTVTTKRKGILDADRSTIKKIEENSKEWVRWFSAHGIETYRVLIGPDKSTIYPEKLPAWAMISNESITRDFVTKAPGVFVYPREDLISLRKRTDLPLYYQTDTHWNTLGAWVAFDALAMSLRSDLPDLVIPSPPLADAVRVSQRIGGDLSTFQRIRPYVMDTELTLTDTSTRKMQISQFDFESMAVISSGDNVQVGAPVKPILVKSEQALNKKRVLWLRDSFGSAMSPFMAATFTETLQAHHQRVNPKVIAELVAKFKPDLVIVTIVERNTRIGILMSPPPPIM